MSVIQPKIGILCYDFPHRKTQDILLRLFLEEIKIDAIFAAGWVKLDIPDSSIRTKIRHETPVHPRKIAQRLGVDYIVVPHNNPDIVKIIKKRRLDLGIITGARILKPEVINSFTIGVINFHPGLLPQARGLDAILWSVYNDIPLGVTAHLIDERVDAGRILVQEKIPVYEDDTFFDLNERLYEKQLGMICSAVSRAVKNDWMEADYSKPYYSKMPFDKEQQVVHMLVHYLIRHKEDGV